MFCEMLSIVIGAGIRSFPDIPAPWVIDLSEEERDESNRLGQRFIESRPRGSKDVRRGYIRKIKDDLSGRLP